MNLGTHNNFAPWQYIIKENEVTKFVEDGLPEDGLPEDGINKMGRVDSLKTGNEGFVERIGKPETLLNSPGYTSIMF